MDEISVKGKKYLKAKVLARELGYTNDYVGQLCRGGKVEAELVGRTWYVNPDSIKGHKQTRYRSTKASTHRELRVNIRQVTEEAHLQEREHFYGHRGVKMKTPQIAYETDEAELLPTPTKEKLHSGTSVFKLPVEFAEAKQVAIDTETDKQYHFEAQKKDETKFFGTLKVTDFITEVSVQGEPEEAQMVKVTGAAKESRMLSRSVVPEGKPDIHTNKALKFAPSKSKLFPVKEPKPVLIAVKVESEETKLPFAYHVITAGAFVSALMIAASFVSLEASILADGQTLATTYTFKAHNLSALIYLVK